MGEETNSTKFSWAKKRQIIIASIVIIVLILLGAAIYFWLFNSQPTCFDGKKNGNETGIDCGGKCSLVCSGLAEDPVVDYTRLFKGIRGYSAVAHITNKNDLIAKAAEYTFKLYDANGALIGERSGSIFLPQIKDLPIYEPNIDTKNVEPTKVVFSFKDGIVWEKSDFVEPKLNIENEKLSGERTEPRLSANIINPTVRTLENVYVTSVLYDDLGNAINASRTLIESIEPDQNITLNFTFPYPLPETIHACAQPVDVALIIDRSGSMASLSSHPPQPLTDVKTAADYFVSQLNDKDKVSVISFANEASSPIDSTLTADIAKIESIINGINIHTDGGQNTNIYSGLLRASEELSSGRHSEGSQKAIVLLTDGEANLPTKIGDPSFAANTALQLASNIKSLGTTIFTIGLGKEVRKDFLQKVASEEDNAFFAPTSAELKGIYQTIGVKICKRGTSRIEISPLVPLQ